MVRTGENGMKKKETRDELTELVRTLLIVQLRVAGFKQKEIRNVVGCDVNRVSAVLKHMKRAASSSSRE